MIRAIATFVREPDPPPTIAERREVGALVVLAACGAPEAAKCAEYVLERYGSAERDRARYYAPG